MNFTATSRAPSAAPALQAAPATAIRIGAAPLSRAPEVLTPHALELLASLHRRFNRRRLELLAARACRQSEFDAGALPDFLAQTAEVRRSQWQLAPGPADLRERRVQITAAVDRKRIINALNAPVRAFMADFEDACSPTWHNVVCGQINLADAIDGTISCTDPLSAKVYRLGASRATPIVRPRGWHLPEKHVRIDGEPVAGALFDFAIFLARNHTALARAGSGPHFYLPKLESHLEARLWAEVFAAAEHHLGLARGSIRATVLIETLPAVFEMDEILFELREYATGLDCGRWDYIFSVIKTLRYRPEFVLPDRSQVGMDRPFLRSCVELLIQTCQRRGAYAMGGANRLPVRRSDVAVGRDALLCMPDGSITEQGIRSNIRVGVQYLEAWLRGSGCVPLYSLMEDAATAEICRAQLWQWLHHGARSSDGRAVTPERIDRMFAEELEQIHIEVGAERLLGGVFPSAARLMERLIKQDEFDDFLTLSAYDLID